MKIPKKWKFLEKFKLSEKKKTGLMYVISFEKNSEKSQKFWEKTLD